MKMSICVGDENKCFCVAAPEVGNGVFSCLKVVWGCRRCRLRLYKIYYSGQGVRQ